MPCQADFAIVGLSGALRYIERFAVETLSLSPSIAKAEAPLAGLPRLITLKLA